MKQEKETITRHGTVEYEVVKCMSCGNEVKADDATTCVIGDLHEDMNTMYTFYKEDVVKGNLCHYCADLNNVTITDDRNFRTHTLPKDIFSGLHYILICLFALLCILILFL